MKHCFFKSGLFVAVLAAGLLAGCEKDHTVSLGVKLEGVGGANSGAKVIMDNYTPKWEGGESVMINNQIKNIVMVDNDAQLQEVDESNHYCAVYPATMVGSMDDAIGEIIMTLPSTQTYNTDASGKQQVQIPMGAYLNASTGTNTLAFKNLCSLVKVTFTNPGIPIKVQSISLTSSSAPLCGTGTVTVKDNATPCLVLTGSTSNTVTLNFPGTGLTVAGTKDFYLAVAPFATASTITISVQAVGYSSAITKTSSAAVTLGRNAIAGAPITITGEVVLGASGDFTSKGGRFLVGENSYVSFAAGNLNYDFTTRKFAFNANQYDYDPANNGNSTIWEHFGWSGNNNGHYGLITSTNNADYSGTSLRDWGAALYLGSTWRTLTNAEWGYLFNSRTGVSITTHKRSDANQDSVVTGARWAQVRVNNKPGIILFPEKKSDGTAFVWPLAKANTPTYINEHANGTWNGDGCKYDLTTWATLEAAGCVFLPAAGYRYGFSISSPGSYGLYWSSTPFGTTDAYYLGFIGTYVNPQGNSSRCNGFSVRLVQNNN